MNDFILIFRHEDGSKVASPEQMQIWMKQTMDWIGGIAAQNKFVSGTGLPFDDARVVVADPLLVAGTIKDVSARFRLRDARRDDVDHHAVLGPLERQRARQVVHRSLRTGIHRAALERDDAEIRAGESEILKVGAGDR